MCVWCVHVCTYVCASVYVCECVHASMYTCLGGRYVEGRVGGRGRRERGKGERGGGGGEGGGRGRERGREEEGEDIIRIRYYTQLVFMSIQSLYYHQLLCSCCSNLC